jgi:hypothetical protein
MTEAKVLKPCRQEKKLMPLKEQRPWYENALLLTIAGSIIVVVGQLAGTIIPIMYGPDDISDFSITVNPSYMNINLSDKSKMTYMSSSANRAFIAEVKIEEFHPYLRPYKYEIYLKALDLPEDMPKVSFYPKEVRAGGKARMFLEINKELDNRATLRSNCCGFYFSGGTFKIQGIGENGKRHNLTVYFDIMS